MKLTELMNLLEEAGPVSLSDEYCKTYGTYDNSGVLIDCASDITGVLFSLDFSINAVTEAKKRGYNVIVTHHPAIFGGINKILISDDPVAKAIERCIKGGMTVISMHLNYDVAPHGIDYQLMHGIGGDEEKEVIMHPVSDGGYGRAYELIKPAGFAVLVDQLKSTFDSERIISYGNAKKNVKRVASFCGAGADEKAIEFAVKNKADVFVSSDLKHHIITGLLDRGICVIQIPHYAAEVYGFRRIVQDINQKLTVPTCFYRDKGLQ